MISRAPGKSAVRSLRNAASVLVVDDDEKVLKRLNDHLRDAGFRVATASSGDEALSAIQAGSLDLVVLDVYLPTRKKGDVETLDGIEVLRRIRAQGNVPVMMLSATSVGAVKVMALSLGADDYMTKPFDMEELTARIHAILRRTNSANEPSTALTFERLRLDPESRTVWKDGQQVDLTAIEFELLHTLARRPRRVFTRQQLIDLAWKHSYYGVPNVVDVHIGHIRKKIEDDPRHPTLIVTIRGTGYRFDDRAAENF